MLVVTPLGLIETGAGLYVPNFYREELKYLQVPI
nr:MAG TPA: hypothetical protein [Caudoviricetes sp.]